MCVTRDFNYRYFGTSLMLEVGFIHSKSHFLLEFIEARGEFWGGRGGVLKGVLKVKSSYSSRMK